MHRPAKSRRPINLNLLARQLHGYAGLLTAPTLLFFALTGTLQLFGLHEARAGYTPSPLLVAAGLLHKDQVLSRPHRHRPPGGEMEMAAKGQGPGAGEAAHAALPQKDRDHAPPQPKLATTLLKIFVAIAAVSLIASTLIGIWIALQNPRRRMLHLGLLAAGVLIPAALVLALR